MLNDNKDEEVSVSSKEFNEDPAAVLDMLTEYSSINIVDSNGNMRMRITCPILDD